MNIAEYVFKLTEAVASLLREALSQKKEEESRYFATELYRIGRLFFEKTDAETQLPQEKPAEGGPDVEVQNAEAKEVEVLNGKKRGPKHYKLNKPLSSGEKTLLTAVLLSEDMPIDREKLALAVYPDISDSMPSKSRKMFSIKSIQTLGLGLAKLRFTLKTGSCGEVDKDFLASVRERYPNITVEQFEQMATSIFEKYDAKIPVAWSGEKSDNRETYTLRKKRERKIRPISDWSQILYSAFFHPDGPSLDLDEVSERVEIEPTVLEPMLNGALETIERNWDSNGGGDKQVQDLIGMLKDKWPDTQFAEIVAICRE